VLFGGSQSAKLFRLVRLLNMKSVNQMEQMHPIPARLAKLICSYLLILHLVACVFWAVVSSESSLPAEMHGPGRWLPSEYVVALEDEVSTQYLHSVYWAQVGSLSNGSVTAL
jgi:hypothetical protein